MKVGAFFIEEAFNKAWIHTKLTYLIDATNIEIVDDIISTQDMSDEIQLFEGNTIAPKKG